MTHNFSTFIFDVDGTLAQTNQLIFESFRHVAKKYLNKVVSDEDIIALFGPTEDVILKEWMKDKYETARKDYFEFYYNEHDKYVKQFDGLEQVLQQILSHKKNLAIFTGKGADSTRITLEKIGFTKYFEIIADGDNVENHKPAPDGIQNVIKHFGVNEEEVLMIGDSPHDISASRSANVKIASVVWDSYAKEEVISLNPDFVFHNVEEFNSFIRDTLKN